MIKQRHESASSAIRKTADSIAWPAPAKLNLFLRVIGQRADGYHELQTIFQLLEWGDDVYVRPGDRPLISRRSANYDVPEAEDLAIRAARLLQSEAGCDLGAEIAVVKRIPMGSGLGGGSSDAATVLVVLNHLWGCGLNESDLAGLGSRLGADVPVFIRGRSSMAEGLGDLLSPVELGERHYVLVFPNIQISTRSVFHDPDLSRDSSRISLAEALRGQGGNDCEAVVIKQFPAMAGIMDSLRKWGRPAMTGTGSGIFIPVKDGKQAKSTAEEIKSLYNVRAVSGVDRSPLHKKLETDGI
jgi:4-diphosphocytidyl-2-C-methyl-D-erythritol kinase